MTATFIVYLSAKPYRIEAGLWSISAVHSALMKRLLLALFIALNAHADMWAAKKPKLMVVIVVDQFRADYISRYQSEFVKDGMAALIKNGAYFPYGEYGLLQAMTGPGHATVLTGAYPYQMGIPLNEWIDSKRSGKTYCVDDPEVKIVGAD